MSLQVIREEEEEDNEGNMSSEDEELLHEWESEDDGEIQEQEEEEMSQQNDSQNGSTKPPEWQEMLKEATFQQKELMEQLKNLKMIQSKSSPSKMMDADTTRTPNQQSMGPENLSSPLLEEISLRNAYLQDEWHEQQQQTVELQDKLNAVQSKINEEQNQWKKEQEELFSPIRTQQTKIPRWGATPTKSPFTSNHNFAAASPSSELPRFDTMTKSNGNKVNESVELTKPQTTTDSSITLLQEAEEKVRQLQAHLKEAHSVNESQKKDLHHVRDRLKTRDLEYHNLLLQYETEKKEWKEKDQDTQSKHRQELESLGQDLDVAEEKLQKQVALNQDLREELQELKANSWKDELEETQNRIKVAIQQQTEKTNEFQTRIKELENKHDEERQDWNTRLEAYKTQLEESDAQWEARYVELEEKYIKETKEWQHLLEMDMTKTFDETENNDDIFRPKTKTPWKASKLSPIPHSTSNRQEANDFSMEDSSVELDRVASESMEKIDGLLEELGQMDAERTAMLDEINGVDGERNQKSGRV